MALWQIAVQAPNLVGRKAALAGLLLGVTFAVAVPTDTGLYRYFIRREARQFAAQWIEDVRNGDVLAAHRVVAGCPRRARAGCDAGPRFYNKRRRSQKGV